MTALYRTSLFRLSLAALLVAGVCHAAEDEIVVTAAPPAVSPLENNGTYRATHSDSATKTATPLNKVPSSVSVINHRPQSCHTETGTGIHTQRSDRHLRQFIRFRQCDDARLP